MPRMMRRHSSAGFSLVELMVGIAVGLVLIAGLSSVYVNSVRGGRMTTSANQLNQEMRALMDIMVNDIRRAGYWSGSSAGVDNAFMAATTAPRLEAGCVLYSYDADFLGTTPGEPGPEDRFGYRLSAGGVVQAVEPGTLASTATPCADAKWEPLTDDISTEVTTLTFDTVGSKCIAFEPDKYVADDAGTYEQWETAPGDGAACDPGASKSPSPYPDVKTHQFVETTQVRITLIGKSRSDPTLPELALNETVLIRANRVIPPTP